MICKCTLNEFPIYCTQWKLNVNVEKKPQNSDIFKRSAHEKACIFTTCTCNESVVEHVKELIQISWYCIF